MHPNPSASSLQRRVRQHAGNNDAYAWFNALISNTDDHPRNHAVIAMDKNGRLFPAYDLTPSMPVSIERRDLALACGDMGRYAHADNLLSQSARFLLPADEAKQVIDTMEQTIRNQWHMGHSLGTEPDFLPPQNFSTGALTEHVAFSKSIDSNSPPTGQCDPPADSTVLENSNPSGS